MIQVPWFQGPFCDFCESPVPLSLCFPVACLVSSPSLVSRSPGLVERLSGSACDLPVGKEVLGHNKTSRFRQSNNEAENPL